MHLSVTYVPICTLNLIISIIISNLISLEQWAPYSVCSDIYIIVDAPNHSFYGMWKYISGGRFQS